MSKLPKVDLLPGWDCYDWRNALTILQYGHPREWQDVVEVLSAARLRHSELATKGGNKTTTATSFDSRPYARGWVEKKFETKIVVDGIESESPTHKVDCFKGKIALEVEWNNKDPFYDRDLNNFRLLYELRVVDVGIVVTRSTELMHWMRQGYADFAKAQGTYGSSTTHFDKLEPRILGGGAGGCPVLVFAMTPRIYLDDREEGNA
ncbi:BglII/BstYI family type II restriction endonuclease [Mesorhizobium sp.]|uniref:BglII/BstYI family type II restriction endonuclease n=1 Tax=Mesorhizobium sp. TaxID=1871066 RepID=UPI000FE8CE3A|nr:BglII/BstYI family type II restriction endonuclease [Mesorhizobium sp.]RWE71577.1 MAG: restriction endonuclease [Mesorhizobium sp.]TIV29225.1 MAG: restriction endonuclease [Mesorhizobium sp.]